jgi:hypothetical protein
VTRLSVRRRQLIGVMMLVVISIACGLALGHQGGPVFETAGHEHCYAEWCVTPRSFAIDSGAVTLRVLVRSDAKQAYQRPDHPQAWLVDGTGQTIGGPQTALDAQLGPGDSYTAALTFATSQPGACPRLRISEGGWPAFLGLGYAPSPFTSIVEWRLCELGS